MDRLWTPWRYSYITGGKTAGRKGVPEELNDWPGDPAMSEEQRGCVFCNLFRSVEWGLAQGIAGAERAGLVVARLRDGYVCLNRYPYSSGHVLLVPYRHTNSLVTLRPEESGELMTMARRAEQVLRAVYKPDGINVGLNLGQAAGAGVAEHLHVHVLPRWFGDVNFMTVTAETRILPETLEQTWDRVRAGFAAPVDEDPQREPEKATGRPGGASQ